MVGINLLLEAILTGRRPQTVHTDCARFTVGLLCGGACARITSDKESADVQSEKTKPPSAEDGFVMARQNR
jgi:hypothetical protein